jgi:hypothetical protein
MIIMTAILEFTTWWLAVFSCFGVINLDIFVCTECGI